MRVMKAFLLMAASAALAVPSLAQDAVVTSTSSGAATPVAPRLVRYTGSMPDAAGTTVAVRFSLYGGQTGGEALWSETQQVSVGTDGKYTVLLGAETAGGLPQDLFAKGDARWVAPQVSGVEKPRTLLAGVPYALKAVDAETLGGHEVSDFQMKSEPATGTAITQINVGSGITGGGTGPTVSLGLNTSYLQSIGNAAYAQLAAANSFHGNQTITGNLTVNGNFAGTAVNGLLSAGNTVYPQLAGNNTMTGTNTFNKVITFTSAQKFPGTATLAGNNSFSGTNAFTKAVTFASGQTFPGAATLAGNNSFSGTNAFTKAVTFASGQTFTGTAMLTGDNSFSGSNAFTKAVTFASGQTFSGMVTLAGNNTWTGTNTYSAATQFNGFVAQNYSDPGFYSAQFTNTSASGGGVYGSSGIVGVAGISTNTSGSGDGVLGEVASPDAFGVVGTNPGAGIGAGVYGTTVSGVRQAC